MTTSGTTQAVRRIFIASPGDLAEERKRFPEILEKLNKVKAHSMDIHLEPVGWEDALPGLGRPQQLINKDVETCDLFVMLLWKRWGTKPAKDSPYSSGTEEEFHLARQLHAKNGKPQIYLYFRQVPEEMMADAGPQLRPVLDFRKKIEEERALLFKAYAEREEWEDLLMDHIARWLDGFQPAPTPVPGPLPTEVQQQISDLSERVRKLTEQHRDAQSKLREIAVDFGKRALDAAKQGRLTEAEELFAKSTQTYAETWTINAFGLYLMQIGALDRAIEKFRQVEEIGKLEDERMYLAVAYANLGLVYKTRGDLNAAEQMLRKSLVIDEELGRKGGMANQYGNLGNIYQTRGDLDSAEEMYRKTLAIEEELGRKESMANAYGNLGLLYQTRGDLDSAEQMHRKSLAINEELGSKEGMASDYGNLGLLYQTRGDLDAAEQMHRKSLAIEEELGRKEGMASDYGNLGLIYKTRGDLDTAEQMHRKSLAINEELGRKEGMASAYGNLGLIYKTRGDLDTAEQMHRKSLAINEELGRKEGMAIQYGNLGTIYKTRGDLTEAKRLWEKALALFEAVGAKPQAAKVRGLLNGLSR